MSHPNGRPCRVIMRDGQLQPGMTLPALVRPPAPHPNKAVQRMRDAWDMRIIAWDGVFPHGKMPRSYASPVFEPGTWGSTMLPGGAR